MSDKPTPKVKIDGIQWRKGVVAGYYGQATDDGSHSFTSGKIEGQAAAKRGEPLNEFLIRHVHPSKRDEVVNWLEQFKMK